MPNLLQTQQSQYFVLANKLMKEILSGHWAIGEQLPSEPELVKQYQMSRYSVRMAISALMDLGLVSRKQGVGTRVIANQAIPRYTQTIMGASDIAHYAQDTNFKILSKQKIQPTKGLEPLLYSAESGEWLQLKGLRTTQDRGAPISLASIYVSPKYVNLPLLGATLNTPVHSMIEEEFNLRVTRIDQEIQGALITQEESEHLEVRVGAAALRITRNYFVDDEMIEATVSVHPAERFSYSMSFQLDR